MCLWNYTTIIQSPSVTDSLSIQPMHHSYDYGFAVAAKEVSLKEQQKRLLAVMPWFNRKDSVSCVQSGHKDVIEK